MGTKPSVQMVLGFWLAWVANLATAAEITLFDGPNFQGRSMTLRGEMSNLGNTDFNDRTSSIIVREGEWEACVDAYFQGGCVRFPPGEYPQLERRFNRSISSLRVVGGHPYAEEPRPERRAARAILYESQDFRGRSFAISADVVGNLDRTGFNDRAASLRVEEGYWIFCSDANFEGDCRTFGPGEYPNLPWELNKKISSGRRIDERYPYNDRPNWNR